MQINIIDAMTLVENAVGAELREMDLDELLVDHGAIRIRRSDLDYPCRAVWCEMTVQAGGVSQSLRIEVTIDEGRMVGNTNPVVRQFVDGAVAFGARHEVLAIQRRKLGADIEKVILEAADEGIELELLAINRLELDLLNRVETDCWDVSMVMLGMHKDEVVRDAFCIEVHTLGISEFADELRTYWLRDQRGLMLMQSQPLWDSDAA